MSLANYQLNGVGFINTDTATNKKYYGNVATGYSIDGTNIGDIFNLNTMSVVAGSITASGYTTNILQYNTGYSWTSAGLTERGYQSCAMSASGQYAVAGVNDSTGKMYYSSDYGKTWNASAMPEDVIGYFYIPSMSASGQYAVACGRINSTGRSYYSSDYGQTWTQTSNAGSNYIFSVAISGSGQYSIKADYPGYLYYSNDYGGTWSNANSSSSSWRTVSMSASGQYAVASVAGSGTGTYLYYSVDYGQTWVASGSSVQSFVEVSMSSSGQYCVGCNNDVSTGKIYYSSDYGQTWSQSTSAPGAFWQSCSISSTGQYALACQNQASGKFYYSTDKGVTWTAMSFATTGSCLGVAISKSGQYALGIMGNQIYYSANTSTTTASKDLADVFEPLYKYKTWANVSGSVTTWNGVSCSNDGKYVVGSTSGSSGKIYYSSNYGGTWTDSNASINDITSITMSNTGKYAHACGYSSTSYTYTSSTFGAANWASPGTGNYFLSIATSSNGLNFIASRNGGPGALSTGYMYYKHGSAGGVALCSGNNPPCNFVALSGNRQYGIACPNANATVGGIYWSTTQGVSWTQSTSFATTSFGGCAISANGQYAIAGAASNGVIYYSNDFGVTWIASNSASASWQDAAMSDSGQYCIFSVGTASIYYSNDYGVNWTSATATLATGHTTNSVAISKNGQYAFVTTSSGTIFRCVATNV